MWGGGGVGGGVVYNFFVRMTIDDHFWSMMTIDDEVEGMERGVGCVDRKSVV